MAQVVLIEHLRFPYDRFLDPYTKEQGYSESVSLKIGEVAEHGGVSVQAIRYYEREGLLPKPPRLASGYRIFPDTAVRRVQFIKRAQELGFSLAEIRELLSLRGKCRRRRTGYA